MFRPPLLSSMPNLLPLLSQPSLLTTIRVVVDLQTPVITPIVTTAGRGLRADYADVAAKYVSWIRIWNNAAASVDALLIRMTRRATSPMLSW